MNKLLTLIGEQKYKPINISFEQYIKGINEYTDKNNIKGTTRNFDQILANVDKYISEKLSHCQNCK